jgi:hypothetical protein
MSEIFQGLVEIQNGGGNTTIELKGGTGTVVVGNNANGRVYVKRSDGTTVVALNSDGTLSFGAAAADGGGTEATLRAHNSAGSTGAIIRGRGRVELDSRPSDKYYIRIDAETGQMYFQDKDGNKYLEMDSNGNLSLGGGGQGGDVIVRDKDGKNRVHIDGDNARTWLGANGKAGEVYVRDANGKDTVAILGAHGRIWLGANGKAGYGYFRNAAGKDTVAIDGANGNITLGGNGHDGDVIVRDKDGKNRIHIDGDNARIWLGANGKAGTGHFRQANGKDTVAILGAHGRIWLGANGKAGEGYFRDANGKDTVAILGAHGRIWLGANGKAGYGYFRNAAGKDTVAIDGANGNITLGGNGHDGDVIVRNAAGTDTIHIDGDAGDVVLKNADCAEEFTVRDLESAESGTVMVLDDDGSVRPCDEAYDSRVAGVVSGAGDYKPGIILDRRDELGQRIPVALMGKVNARADASYGAIKLGDLLTTAPRPGYAMKASDRDQAFGSVLGKAMAPLDEGTGMIPVLVALQ